MGKHADIEKERINAALAAWHKATAEVNYNSYFDLMTEDAIFIGTYATENWNKQLLKFGQKPFLMKAKLGILSMTVPNDTVTEVVKIKASFEDTLLKKLQK